MTDGNPRNIRLLIAFDGTNYSGWQRQKKDPTIQGVIEEKISLMTNAAVVLHGAGRTDAGVHALGMVANFSVVSKIPLEGFRKGLNSLLPDDIRIIEACEESASFHARKNARGKTYLYRLTLGEFELPTERLYAVHMIGNFDLRAVRQAATYLIGEHDFSSFEAAGSRVQHDSGRGAVRRIFKAELLEGDGRRIDFEISGDGFLRHMVRNIVGTLLLVGKGKLTHKDFSQIIESKDRRNAGPTAPAKGLFLKEVFYSNGPDADL